MELSRKLLDVGNQSSLFSESIVNSSLTASCGSMHDERPDPVHLTFKGWRFMDALYINIDSVISPKCKFIFRLATYRNEGISA